MELPVMFCWRSETYGRVVTAVNSAPSLGNGRGTLEQILQIVIAVSIESTNRDFLLGFF